jgi:hypothetical protein
MEKQKLIDEMSRQAGAMFATKTQIAAWFGIKDTHYINRYVDGLKAVDGKYYFIPDLAGVMERRAR